MFGSVLSIKHLVLMMIKKRKMKKNLKKRRIKDVKKMSKPFSKKKERRKGSISKLRPLS